MPSVEQLLDEAEATIRASRAVDLWRPSDARVNGEELLGKVLGKPIEAESLDDEVPPRQAQMFRRLVARRAGGEPVALILGYTEFRKMKLHVRKGVFVPRNSSELLAEKAIGRLRRRRSPVAVDVATGTGPVALAIANEVPGAEVLGLDIWAPSLAVARSNARRLGLNVRFVKSDMLSRLPQSLKGRTDVFTCHPPYVARAQVRTLPKEIRDHEPRVSLSDNSPDGLGMVNRLADETTQWLKPGGWVLIEVSPDLSRAVGSILRRAGFQQVRSERDSLGATRVISGRLARSGNRTVP